MKYLVFILFIVWGVECYSQKGYRLHFEEKQADTLNIKLDSILFIGGGSTPAKVFLQDVCDLIKTALEKKGVYSEFHFLGSKESEAKQIYDSIPKKGFSAIFFILPEGNSSWDIKGNMRDVQTLLLFGKPMATYSAVNFEQKFVLALCLPEDLKKVWVSSLDLFMDITQPKNAKGVAKRIMTYMESHNYVGDKKTKK